MVSFGLLASQLMCGGVYGSGLYMDEVGNTRRKKNQDYISICAGILPGGK